MSALTVCLTFDIDLVMHANQQTPIDEFTQSLPALEQMFGRHPQWTATWFVRMDDQIAVMEGAPDALFDRHAARLSQLTAAGHEIGWHPHAYARAGSGWQQNTDGASVANELGRLAPLARRRGLRAVRTGWGFHTNQTMQVIADAGFAIDSSAMPRPRYAWETSVKDWTITPREPFHPSVADYRVPGDPQWPILEVPMSVTALSAPNDDGAVLRYLNPAFHASAFAPAASHWLTAHDHLVTITHPYELTGGGRHPLISFDLNVFERNIEAIESQARDAGRALEFATLSRFAASR